MLILILTVCALAPPFDCREERLQFAEDVAPAMCMMQAQPYLAQWIGEHPALRVARWRCAYPERDGGA